MHVAEVDLNYTQYYPLSESYVSLYPQKSSTDDEKGGETTEAAPRPVMWAEVEKCMEEGTLNRLRNRVSTAKAITAPRPPDMRPVKPKPKQAATLDTTGMNRRQRRSQGLKDVFAGKTKNKSMAFERNQAFGSSQANNRVEDDGEDDSDGGFFEK